VLTIKQVIDMKMNERKKKVLLAIVQDYIQTAEPVGSRTIAKKFVLKVSPATIRNEMADLEEMGLIEQPHTSAGRIPSYLGYRYYVDCLMEKEPLLKNELERIELELNKKIKQMEEIIQQTSRLLSEMTRYTSLMDSPALSHKAIKHVQLIPLQPTQALVVVVTETGSVMNRVLSIPEAVSADDLSRISQVLNKKLLGQSMETVRKAVLEGIYADLLHERNMLNVVLEALEQAMVGDGGQKVYLGGTLNILNQPEFKDVEKIKRILGILDEENIVRNLLTASTGAEGVSVRIGKENNLEAIDGCSVITATYSVEGEKVGTIGILGPTRMNYAKAVAVVDVISKTLSKVLSDIYK
jgi:heat-inducible transcriptional repressor